MGASRDEDRAREQELRDELRRLDLGRADDSDDAQVLDRVADIRWELWDLQHVSADLTSAIAAAKELAKLADDPPADVAGARGAKLGTLLMIWYTRTGDQEALHEAIAMLEQGARDLNQSDPEQLECLSTLSTALIARHERAGIQDDIDLAVSLTLQVIDRARSEEQSRLDEYCLRAGAALADRFEHYGDDQDLIDAVEFFREALAESEKERHEVSGRCADLARALLIAYRRWARAEDLDEAAVLYRRAIDELPAGHYEIASHKSGLGGVLSTRYEHYGDSADLAPAVDLLSEAFELTGSSHPAKIIRLGRLAEALLGRFGHFRSEPDLRKAIVLLEDGLSEPALDPNMRSSIQVGLARALRARGLARRSASDLRRAEGLLEEVQQHSKRTSRRDSSLDFNLASIRADIYFHTGETTQLLSSISGMREAVKHAPTDSPARSHAATFLAQLLFIYAEGEGATNDSALLSECLELSRDAALDTRLAPALGLISATTWADLTNESDRLVAYERALALLPLLSHHGLTVADSIVRLRDAPSIASDACAAFINAGQLDRAVEVLEEGRVTTVRLRMRMRADVEGLRAARADLAEAYEHALEATNATDSGLAVDPRGEPRLLQELLSRIRAIEGFGRFGLPRRFAEIQALAGDATVVYLNTSISRCDALIVSETGVSLVPMSTTSADIARRATDFSKYMERSADSKSFSEVVLAESSARSMAAWLWDVIVGPVMAHLHIRPQDETIDSSLWPRIWWIPTGHLVLLPMQMAGYHCDYGSHATQTDRTTIDRVVSTQLSSIEMLAASRHAPQDHADDIRCLIVATSQPEGEAALPGVSKEVKRLVAQLGRDRVTLLADDAALVPDGPSTKSAVVAALPGNNWAHFACHAAASPLVPTESQLILTDHRNEPFRAEDLLVVRPAEPRLAFFSACSTAHVSPDLSHEPIHFGIAASLAGYAHSVLTLWPVLDDPEVPAAIYKELLASTAWPRDSCTAAAVHNANRLMREQSANALHRWSVTIHQGL